ncbi:hypothetical protein I552_6997 [Mycobacterium xenopi 3993]|nr:hypothetical protein I552_6997 [Mycobacterium xenopi 3993]
MRPQPDTAWEGESRRATEHLDPASGPRERAKRPSRVSSVASNASASAT